MTQIVPSVTVQVTTSDPPVTLTPVLMAALARELAIGLREPADIVASWGITPEVYEKLKANELFSKTVESARVEWHSAGNTNTRLALEAAFTMEQALPHLYARAINGKEPLNHAVDFLKLLTDLGGLKKDASKGQATEKFQIVINLGADTQFNYEGTKTVDAAPELTMIPVVDDAEDRV
jgi:hypothetical protein